MAQTKSRTIHGKNPQQDPDLVDSDLQLWLGLQTFRVLFYNHRLRSLCENI